MFQYVQHEVVSKPSSSSKSASSFPFNPAIINSKKHFKKITAASLEVYALVIWLTTSIAATGVKRMKDSYMLFLTHSFGDMLFHTKLCNDTSNMIQWCPSMLFAPWRPHELLSIPKPAMGGLHHGNHWHDIRWTGQDLKSQYFFIINFLACN